MIVRLQKTVILFLLSLILAVGCLSVSSMEEIGPDKDYILLNPISTGISQEDSLAKEKESEKSSNLRCVFLELEKPEVIREPKVTVTVVIDVFRAFTTACYILQNNPATYILTNKSTVISQLASQFQAPLLIGKPEISASIGYNIPNSPTRVQEINITGQNVLHRTEAGAKGILDAKGADLILAAGLVNADATVLYIKKLINPVVNIAPMGHEGTTPSLEDDICAQYIKARLQGQMINLEQYYIPLREGPGRYFFSHDQWQYPRQDFECCLNLERFNFAIQAEVQGDYAILTRLEESSY
jgi:2-phosphosulfolactate phosphatase